MAMTKVKLQIGIPCTSKYFPLPLRKQSYISCSCPWLRLTPFRRRSCLRNSRHFLGGQWLRNLLFIAYPDSFEGIAIQVALITQFAFANQSATKTKTWRNENVAFVCTWHQTRLDQEYLRFHRLVRRNEPFALREEPKKRIIRVFSKCWTAYFLIQCIPAFSWIKAFAVNFKQHLDYYRYENSIEMPRRLQIWRP